MTNEQRFLINKLEEIHNLFEEIEPIYRHCFSNSWVSYITMYSNEFEDIIQVSKREANQKIAL